MHKGPLPYREGSLLAGGFTCAGSRGRAREETPPPGGIPLVRGGPCARGAETNYPAVINKLTPPAAAAQQVYYSGNRNDLDSITVSLFVYVFVCLFDK